MFRESQSNDEVCRNRVLFLVSIFQLGIAVSLPTLPKVKFSHVGIHETTEALSLRFLWTVLCLSLLRTVVFPFWHWKTPNYSSQGMLLNLEAPFRLLDLHKRLLDTHSTRMQQFISLIPKPHKTLCRGRCRQFS